MYMCTRTVAGQRKTNERLSELIGELREEKWALAIKQESLEAEIQELQKQLVNSTHVTKPISLIEVQRQSSERDRVELENRTSPVEASGQSESGETSDLSSSRGIGLNVRGEDLATIASKPE